MHNLSFDADPLSDLPPLLMVHGFLSSRRQWLPNAALSQHFRRVRIDLPGHGDTPPPRGAGEACPEFLVRQFDRLRQALGIGRWHLCGHSFGAGLTLRYALDFPDHCGGLVFTNANAALRGALTDAEREAYATQQADLRAHGAPALARMRYHPRHARGLDPALQAQLVADAGKVDPEGFALLLEHVLPRLSVRERLTELQVPVLLVNGRRERRFQPLRHWLAETRPEIRILDLDGGHSVNLDCAPDFTSAVQDFLRPLPLDARQGRSHA